MKLAYFSPLTPQRSGISDYSEELLPLLAGQAEITLFVDGFQPINRELTSRFEVLDYRRKRSHLKKLAAFDVVIYHMGNDHRYHTGMLEAMQTRPGVVVFHDFALQDFFLGLARDRSDLRLYLNEVERCYGWKARDEAAEFLTSGATPPITNKPLEFPLNCRIAKSAEGIIVHSAWQAERFAKLAPVVPCARIKLHITREAAAAAPCTDRPPNSPVRIASFGLITPDKGIERALRILANLKSVYDFRYTLVGSDSNFPELPQMIARYGLSDRVSVTGHVSLEEFQQWIAETDIAISLRERTVGETSASLCRTMVAGVAAIVSDVGAFSEFPNDAVVKVDHGDSTDALLEAYLRRLIEDEPLRVLIGRNARAHVLGEHRIEDSAAKYIEFLHRVIATGPRRRLLDNVANELAVVGVRASDEQLLRSIATEVATLAPAAILNSATESPHRYGQSTNKPPINQNGHGTDPVDPAHGRGAKIEGVDYKRAAREYPQKLDAERHHYLFTKPFYNLANKPPKHTGDGMDAETHRHFCDFANLTVALALPAGRRILDVGCGSGWLSEYLARLGYEVTGIDISPELIEIAQQRTACVLYDVDHETPLLCRFLAHDVESSPLAETFDAVVCYDSLHHFEDERAVMRNISAMIDYGGLLFILEGGKPEEGSATAEELTGVMHEYETLESPFDATYLRSLLVEHGFLVVGDYVSVNGLFDRGTIEGDRVSFVPEDLNYLLCKKVVRGVASASRVADSRAPGKLAARITPTSESPASFAPGASLSLAFTIENTGDTVWLTGPASRRGAVMLGLKLRDDAGRLVTERHGEPPLPRALVPGESVQMRLHLNAPEAVGGYSLKIDMVAQHVCWFEQAGSEPLVLTFDVREGDAIRR